MGNKHRNAGQPRRLPSADRENGGFSSGSSNTSTLPPGTLSPRSQSAPPPPAAQASSAPSTTAVNPQVQESNTGVLATSIVAGAFAKDLVTAAASALTVPGAGQIVAGVLIAAAVAVTIWTLFELYTAPPIAVPHPIAIPIPAPPHGNNKNNPNPHIVYKIIYFDTNFGWNHKCFEYPDHKLFKSKFIS